MTLETSYYLVSAGYAVLGYVLPVVLFLVLRRRRYSGPGQGPTAALVSILFCWILLFAYRELTRGITVDYINTYIPPLDDEGTPVYYDGVGGNVFILILGWLPAFLTLTALYLLRRLWRWLRPKPAAPDSASINPPPTTTPPSPKPN